MATNHLTVSSSPPSNSVPNTYPVNDNTSYSSLPASSPAPAVTFLLNDSVTITGSGATNLGLNTKVGHDTLVINTTLTGSGATAANSLIQLGGGNDIVTINSAVSNYRIDGGAANDTLVINANLSGTVITGNSGADSILFASGTITGGQLSVGSTTVVADGADTLTIATGAKGVGTFITNFSRAQDTLIIGSTTITGLASLATGSYNAAQYGATAGANDALYSWLNDGGNRITLI